MKWQNVCWAGVIAVGTGCSDAVPSESVAESVEKALSGCDYDWQHIVDYEDREGLDRSFVDAHEGPVGKRDGGCTGTLIGDGLLLTVRHLGCASRGSKYTFHTQLKTEGDPTQRESYDAVEVVETHSIDLGLMRIAFNPEYRWGAATIDMRFPEPGEQIAVIGHPGSLAETRSYKVVDVGTVSHVTANDIGMRSIDMADGASGSGVLSTETGTLIGVARSGPNGCPNGTGTANTMPRIAGVSEFIQSDRASGRFYTTANGGFGSFRSLSTTWSSRWRHIVRGDFSGDGLDDLFFYDPDGWGRFYRLNGSSQISALGPAVDLRDSAAQLVALQLDGSGPMELYYYNPRPTRGNGVEAFYATDGEGGLTQIRANSGLRSDWRLITAGDFTKRAGTELLFYRPDFIMDEESERPVLVGGAFALYGTTASGGRTLLGTAQTDIGTYSIMVSGQFSRSTSGGFDRDELLAYDVINGTATFFAFTDSGSMTQIGHVTDLPLITQITTGKFNASAPDFVSQVMFFSPTNGEMSFYSVSEGELTLLSSNINRRSYGIIHAGRYRATATSELMLYDRYRP